MGARFDAAFDGTTDFTTNGLPAPALSANDPDTAANELRTHVILTGSAAEGEGMFSFGDLLGSGMATDEGARFVAGAMEDIGKVRADVVSLLALDSSTLDLDNILENQWTKIEDALGTVFKTAAVRTTAPREEDILDEIDDILDALSSEDAFVAATAANGGGVFESQELGASAAMDTFNRVAWSATATMGATGATRYGTAIRKNSDNARDGLTTQEVGAFSYSTISETLRTSQAAAVSLTGIASYTGGTEAISGDGTTYSGTMDLQVRFSANTVSGVVKDLLSAEGQPWQHNFAGVERIVLDDARLQRNAQWNNTTGTDATVFYTADSGLLRPITGLTNRFRGILLGTGADAGSQASGVWEVNARGSTNFLTGGFGVRHIGDASRPTPGPDPGGASNAMLMTTTTTSVTQYDGSTPLDVTPDVSIADGKLTVKVARFGWLRGDNTTTPVQYVPFTDDPEDTPTDATDDVPVRATAEFDLEALAGNGIGAKTTVNGPKWADSVKATLEAQRDQIATLRALGTRSTQTMAEEANAWQRARDAIQYQLFGGDLPLKLAGDYATDTDLQEDALDLLDRAIDALSNATKLFAATDPGGTGVFDHFGVDGDGDNEIETDPNGDGDTSDSEVMDFIHYEAAVDRRWETIGYNAAMNNGRTLANILGEREHKVVASVGTTDYTRFGVWYRVGAVSAVRTERESDGTRTNHAVKKGEGGPGSFAFSPLDPTMAGTNSNPAFPRDGSATYVGETVAVMDEDVLTGTAKVDVRWATPQVTVDGTDTVPANRVLDLDVTDNTSIAGLLTLTLSDLADGDGDPLAYTAAIGGNDPNEGFEIAEIVFSGMTIEKGLAGGNSGHLIVGAEGTADATTGEYTYTEIGLTPATDVRYRLTAIGMTDPVGSGSAGDASVGALFVGQGVDGPLGVIGTYTLTDTNVARVNAAGNGVEEGGVMIRGGFGVDVP